MEKKDVVKTRLAIFRKLVAKNKFDGFLITNYLDQFYLLDFAFNADETVLLVTSKGTVCFTRSLYVVPFKAARPSVKVVGEDGNRLLAAVAYAKEIGLKSVGFDAAKESYSNGKILLKNNCKEGESLVAQLRREKDAEELKRLRASNRLAYQTYAYIRPRIKTGVTETQIAADMEHFMRAHGATCPSFSTIVAFGENAANPHHVTGGRKLKAEECVLIDFGCIYQGYCSDMTRSWWNGKKEPAEYTKIWNLVNTARKEGIKAVRPGHTGQQVDATSRAIIEKAGYGEYFTHGTGHGVGIEIHENPYNSQQCTDQLKAGNIVTVEPGIYLPGKYGVRIEDTVAVTQKGVIILTRK